MQVRGPCQPRAVMWIPVLPHCPSRVHMLDAIWLTMRMLLQARMGSPGAAGRRVTAQVQEAAAGAGADLQPGAAAPGACAAAATPGSDSRAQGTASIADRTTHCSCSSRSTSRSASSSPSSTGGRGSGSARARSARCPVSWLLCSVLHRLRLGWPLVAFVVQKNKVPFHVRHTCLEGLPESCQCLCRSCTRSSSVPQSSWCRTSCRSSGWALSV